jgi:hypothetical protein
MMLLADGRILSLSTQPNHGERYNGVEVTLRAGQGGARTEIVEPHIPVTVTVHGRWELVSTP